MPSAANPTNTANGNNIERPVTTFARLTKLSTAVITSTGAMTSKPPIVGVPSLEKCV